MNVRIASEAWICWSFARPSEWRLWILIWISSWNPLKLCDAIRRTTSAPPGQNPGRARPRSAHSPLQSHHSNAPIEPISQSNLSKIVALLTARRKPKSSWEAMALSSSAPCSTVGHQGSLGVRRAHRDLDVLTPSGTPPQDFGELTGHRHLRVGRYEALASCVRIVRIAL
jgi:hypothetical protein